MGNFTFLMDEPNYAMFARACVEAEQALSLSPTICALSARRAFELAVKWMYAADKTIRMPYKDNLQSLVHEPTFRAAIMDEKLCEMFQYVIKAGNIAAHRNSRLKPEDAIFSLQVLFAFIEWIDYSYGTHYVKRGFDPNAIPAIRRAIDAKERKAREDEARKQAEAQLNEKDGRIAELERKIRELGDQLAQRKESQPPVTVSDELDYSEYETRKRFIDLDLQSVGWNMDRDVETEREVADMEGEPGRRGLIDYLLKGRDGRPLAIIEAKRTSYDPRKGLQQATLYADCLEREYGYRPLIFLSNGYMTYIVDDHGHYRQVGQVFAQDDMQRLMTRRGKAIDPRKIPVNRNVAGDDKHYYQLEAINAVCENIHEGRRRNLLVMATGTGKTRTAAALADVLMRSGLVKNVLFLADRVELVEQAKGAFGDYYPDWWLCNLCKNKKDADATVVFSTYQTMINAIDTTRADDGNGGDRPIFSSGHFDLIIVDEAHRSIFRKYRTIFEHFDALMVGLTATPRDEVDRNTYDFFDAEHGVPTYVYEYETALRDNVLVPYLNVEASTKFIDEGITYDELSDADKERFEEDFGSGEIPDGGEVSDGLSADGSPSVPDHVAASDINTYVMNADTVDTVIRDLLDHGIRTDGGERIGKTIIFAQNQAHARFIAERFAALEPTMSANGFVKVVVSSDDRSSSIIKEFKDKPNPVVAVSVDMMDTGVDVPAVVNLVFFKRVRSKIKFLQMIGRGTRLCPELDCVENLDGHDGEYVGKHHFVIFDYCGNFAFFRQHQQTVSSSVPTSLSERIFSRKTELIQSLQSSAFTDDESAMALRERCIDDVCGQIAALDDTTVAVRLRREAVERYRRRKAFEFLSSAAVHEIVNELAPMAAYGDDVYALRFDVLMYGLMVAAAGGDGGDSAAGDVRGYVAKIRKTVGQLRERMTIGAVREHKAVIDRVSSDGGYLEGASIAELDDIRVALRDLIRFIADEGRRKSVITDLTDPVTSRVVGQSFDMREDYSDYKAKVNRYVNEHRDDGVIRKLRHNEPMTADDYSALERIFVEQLGSRDDYEATYRGEQFGVLIRRIAGLDHDAVNAALGDYLHEGEWSQAQIAFMHKVADYVERNGYLEPGDLLKSPFDRPRPMLKLFKTEDMAGIVARIREINANALAPAA
ncbi:DEAD/DEAH box helicase [Bifidobacterium primatium]|uniref:DEAD/DEAH box helicase n=2 Tax=Bifidobacterium TaxID=1678 RepID=A0A2M9H9N9_9BIFI|nr:MULTISPECIES: DEAD/DEAH box helicase family protein [Bifidobacterium]NEG96733.1 DUF4145 domain-containing protein [Bifidobacterium sp. SMB2]NEH11889.1 DUF4145 domain-containing protein [Bifidobacterium saimiriisciurei]PJM73520.1 DEAD/DEAH box helicase [Bifidobacterium primatium]